MTFLRTVGSPSSSLITPGSTDSRRRFSAQVSFSIMRCSTSVVKGLLSFMMRIPSSLIFLSSINCAILLSVSNGNRICKTSVNCLVPICKFTSSIKRVFVSVKNLSFDTNTKKLWTNTASMRTNKKNILCYLTTTFSTASPTFTQYKPFPHPLTSILLTPAFTRLFNTHLPSLLYTATSAA